MVPPMVFLQGSPRAFLQWPLSPSGSHTWAGHWPKRAALWESGVEKGVEHVEPMLNQCWTNAELTAKMNTSVLQTAGGCWRSQSHSPPAHVKFEHTSIAIIPPVRMKLNSFKNTSDLLMFPAKTQGRVGSKASSAAPSKASVDMCKCSTCLEVSRGTSWVEHRRSAPKASPQQWSEAYLKLTVKRKAELRKLCKCLKMP